jgi:hypothetical protein
MHIHYFFIKSIIMDYVHHCNCLLSAGDLKVYRAIGSPSDFYFYRQTLISVHERCSANFKKLNFSEIRMTFFSNKTKVLNHQ